MAERGEQRCGVTAGKETWLQLTKGQVVVKWSWSSGHHWFCLTQASPTRSPLGLPQPVITPHGRQVQLLLLLVPAVGGEHVGVASSASTKSRMYSSLELLQVLHLAFCSLHLSSQELTLSVLCIKCQADRTLSSMQNSLLASDRNSSMLTSTSLGYGCLAFPCLFRPYNEHQTLT